MNTKPCKIAGPDSYHIGLESALSSPDSYTVEFTISFKVDKKHKNRLEKLVKANYITWRMLYILFRFRKSNH